MVKFSMLVEGLHVRASACVIGQDISGNLSRQGIYGADLSGQVEGVVCPHRRPGQLGRWRGLGLAPEVGVLQGILCADPPGRIQRHQLRQQRQRIPRRLSTSTRRLFRQMGMWGYTWIYKSRLSL